MDVDGTSDAPGLASGDKGQLSIFHTIHPYTALRLHRLREGYLHSASDASPIPYSPSYTMSHRHSLHLPVLVTQRTSVFFVQFLQL